MFKDNQPLNLHIDSKWNKTCLYEKNVYTRSFPGPVSRIWTEYGDLQSKPPDSVRMLGNTDQINSEYVHFSPNEIE